MKPIPLLLAAWASLGGLAALVAGEPPPEVNAAARQYLALLERFAGFAAEHWNETAESYDAAGKGVTWARGNGGVCLVNAVLLAALPERQAFSARQIPRPLLLDRTRRTIRRLCLTSAVCTDPRAAKTGTWGGADPKGGGWHWQAGLETEHWVVAARLLEAHLDDDTKALVRQVATAEADGAARREIRSGRKGDTAADDCAWNAGILGACAAFYADDPRARSWDEHAKRWALNMDGREPDRTSERVIDGKPLREWLVATNVYPDLTLENHGFWDLPYQLGFAALAEPALAYHLSGKPIPEAFHAHAVEAGESILRWLVLPDGDLLCPQGIDWAERDVQHSWGFTVLGTLLDRPWARAAEARCLKLLASRQAAFGDGSIHALDFGYETDLAVIWAFSFLLHRHFGKSESGPGFDELRGAKVFPHVAAAVYRTPDVVSSVTWFRNRQGILVSPNDLDAVRGRESFTRYDRHGGTGWILMGKDRKPRAFEVAGEPVLRSDPGGLAVAFRREVSRQVRQEIGYAALPTGEVVVFSRWTALRDLEVTELVDHPFRWVEIAGFIAPPDAKQTAPGVWAIDGKLQMQVLGGPAGEAAADGINGAVRRAFTARAGETMLDTVCVYQAMSARRAVRETRLEGQTLRLGNRAIARGADASLTIRVDGTAAPADRRSGSLVLLAAGTARGQAPADRGAPPVAGPSVTVPPESFFEMVDARHRDAARQFYKKHIDVRGMPVAASAEVADLALQRTHSIVTHLLAGRPDVIEAMVKNRMYLIIIGKDQVYTGMPEYRNHPNPAYQNERVRGTGGRPTSFGEENLLSLPIDRYDDESIGVHEFCHTIDGTLRSIDPTWSDRRNAVHRAAVAKGLWKNTYAASSAGEFWAEICQSYFDCNRVNNWNHGPIGTREQLKVYDPESYELVRTAFNLRPEQDWRYGWLQTLPNVAAAPAKLKIDPYYTKFTWAREFSVVGRGAKDEALLEANDTIRKMFAYRHDILKALIADGVKLAVLGRDEKLADLPELHAARDRKAFDPLARFLDYAPETKLLVVAEENVLGDHKDPLVGDCLTVRGLAKALYHVTAHRPVDPDWDKRGRAVQQYELRVERLDVRFDEKLKGLHEDAMQKGKWKGTAAVHDRVEYWASGVLAYFDAAGQGAAPHDAAHPIATREELKEYDPGLFGLVNETMAYDGHVDWRRGR